MQIDTGATKYKLGQWTMARVRVGSQETKISSNLFNLINLTKIIWPSISGFEGERNKFSKT